MISAVERDHQAERFGAAAANVHRADLLDALAAAVPEAAVTLGARCAAVESLAGGAHARFEDGSEVEADAIVGADGIHSVVRASLFGPDAPRFTGKICYRSVIGSTPYRARRPIRTSDLARAARHDRRLPRPPRRADQRRLPLRRRAYAHESWIAECSRDEVLERYGGWHESLRGIFLGGERWYKWALYDRDPIARWTVDRVTVLGDAAHPMLPYLGQGAGQTIEDGCVLAAALAAEPGDPVAGLERYERSRRPRASAVVLARASAASATISPRRSPTLRRDIMIGLRRRRRSDPEGRGAAWIADYDAGSPAALAG